MSKIVRWHTGSFHFYNAIDNHMPFNFPILMRIFNIEGIRHFDSMDHYNLATIALSNKIINADGIRDKKEIKFIHSFYEKFFSEKKAKSALYLLNQYFQFPTNNSFYVELLKDINQYLNKEQKRHLIYYLFELSDADGEIENAELREIYKICHRICISKKEINQISALYISGYVPFPPTSRNFDDRKYGTNHRYRKKEKKTATKNKRIVSSSSFRLTLSYQVLGINLNSTVAQIKAAYRKLVKENHPDRFALMGEFQIKKATEKITRINNAYDYIKRVKRFS